MQNYCLLRTCILMLGVLATPFCIAHRFDNSLARSVEEIGVQDWNGDYTANQGGEFTGFLVRYPLLLLHWGPHSCVGSILNSSAMALQVQIDECQKISESSLKIGGIYQIHRTTTDESPGQVEFSGPDLQALRQTLVRSRFENEQGFQDLIGLLQARLQQRGTPLPTELREVSIHHHAGSVEEVSCSSERLIFGGCQSLLIHPRFKPFLYPVLDQCMRTTLASMTHDRRELISSEPILVDSWGIYQNRKIAGTSHLSRHAFASALDLHGLTVNSKIDAPMNIPLPSTVGFTEDLIPIASWAKTIVAKSFVFENAYQEYWSLLVQAAQEKFGGRSFSEEELQGLREEFLVNQAKAGDDAIEYFRFWVPFTSCVSIHGEADSYVIYDDAPPFERGRNHRSFFARAKKISARAITVLHMNHVHIDQLPRSINGFH